MSAGLSDSQVADTEPGRVARRRRCLATILGAGAAGAAAGAAVGAAVPGTGLAASAAAAAGAAALAGRLAARALRGPAGLPVLTYHSVSDDARWLPWHREISIRPETLDRHLRLFRRMGLRVIDTEAAVRARLAGALVPADAVALHFDDGYLDNWVAAAPLLRRHGACATVFVSTDFVAPDGPPRPTMEDAATPQWHGYMNWAELRHLEASGLVRVEAHGTDHGRVETGPRVVGRLTATNAGRLSWMQWARMPGAKHDWYRHDRRPVPLGSPVRESAPSLSARQWTPDGGTESAEAYDDRVRETFARCIDTHRREMGRAPVLFCWPQNRTAPRARALAAEAGFLATTAGRGRNTAAGAPRVIARVHAGQDYAGFRCGWIDDVAMRAHIRLFQGCMGWSVALAAISLLRRLVRAASRLSPAGAPRRAFFQRRPE